MTCSGLLNLTISNDLESSAESKITNDLSPEQDGCPTAGLSWNHGMPNSSIKDSDFFQPYHNLFLGGISLDISLIEGNFTIGSSDDGCGSLFGYGQFVFHNVVVFAADKNKVALFQKFVNKIMHKK